MHLLYLYYLLIPCFGWELRRPKDPKPETHKFSHFIQTAYLENLPKLSRLPQLSKAKSLHVPEEMKFDPCSSSKAVCLNGGTCVNKDGSFLCQCPSTHYGKKCEVLADMRRCEGNKCKNNATCISLPRTVEIIDPDLSASYNHSKTDTSLLNQADLQRIMINVSYECKCPSGWVGTFCEMSEVLLQCQEDYCMGRGSGYLMSDGITCTCDCHENWIGDRCETENPCKNYQCYNSGECRPHVDKEKGIVEAFCECPKIQIMDNVVVSGEQCENLHISDSDYQGPYMPCKAGTSMYKWFQEAGNWMHMNFLMIDGASQVASDLRGILGSCLDNQDRRCNTTKMTNHLCLNGGQCEPRVISFPPTSISLLMPFCKCLGSDAGRFCEYEREDECDPSPEEKAIGVTRSSRCTDEQHGSCVVVLGEPKCLCKPGYVGEMCETYDPCADNPCQNSECIPIPSETIIDKVGEQKQTYRCLCGMGDDMSGPNKCVFPSTGNCSNPHQCHEGQCVTCDHSSGNDDDVEGFFQFCNAEQQKDGFRCICKPGFHPPYCEALADPCAGHMCENGGTCIAAGKYDYDCQCNPGTRGDLCEDVYDICLAMGAARCRQGDCYPDRSTLRGFRCDCHGDYYGRDCEQKMRTSDLWTELLWTGTWAFLALPTLVVVTNFGLVVGIYFCCMRRVKIQEIKLASLEPSSLFRPTTDETIQNELSMTTMAIVTKTSMEKPSVFPV